jgi:hypothetical protein
MIYSSQPIEIHGKRFSGERLSKKPFLEAWLSDRWLANGARGDAPARTAWRGSRAKIATPPIRFLPSQLQHFDVHEAELRELQGWLRLEPTSTARWFCSAVLAADIVLDRLYHITRPTELFSTTADLFVILQILYLL